MLEIAPSTRGLAYDHDGEAARVAWPDVVVGGKRLNRATARIEITAPVETKETAAERKAVLDRLFSTTLDPMSPVVELGWPVAGPFVMGPQGVTFDGHLAVGQKLLDEHHPRIRAAVSALLDHDLLLRREIATDDFVAARPGCPVKTPADLASLWNEAMQARWSEPDGWRAFFSSSGTEAVEAALKLCYESAYKRFLGRFGTATFRRVQQALGTPLVPWFDRDPSLKDHAVYADYPFQVVACEGSFHGRTLGSLQLTRSKRAHQLAYPKARNVHHVPYNATDDPVRRLVDSRGIEELLSIPGELARVMRDLRRVPKDLLAAVVAEPFQGEGGYVPGEPVFFRDLRTICDETGALLVLDEVQSVARTGALFAGEHVEVRPDVVATAKSMVIGVTLAPADLEKNLHHGWHSNTWGSGRVFDVNVAYAVLDALLHDKEPAFAGRSYLENETLKGERLAAGLSRLAERHPSLLVSHRGRGLMRAIVVRRRDAIVKAAWDRGLKLLGCGFPGETAVIRLLFLADTLSREVDEFLRVLDLALSDVEKSAG